MSSNRGKKVLILCTSIYGGGAEKTVAQLSHHIKGSPIIAVFNKKERSLKYKGHLINLNFKPSNGLLRKVYQSIRRIIVVYSIKKRLKPDVVISFMQAPNLLNVLTKGKERVVISIRNYDTRKYKEIKNPLAKLEFTVFKKFINNADKIISVSEDLTALIEEDYNISASGKVQAIQNGCNVNAIIRDSKESLSDQMSPIFDSPVIINVGKLEEQKGHKHLIMVFSQLIESKPNAKLMILGKGTLLDDLVFLCQELKLNTYYGSDQTLNDTYQVYFMGFVENPYPLLRNAKIFALTSYYEGFPNVLLEAMACGLPIISSDCYTGPRELLLDNSGKEYGILLPEFVKDNQEFNELSIHPKWTEALLSLLKDEERSNEYSMLSEIRVMDFTIESKMQEWNRIIFDN